MPENARNDRVQGRGCTDNGATLPLGKVFQQAGVSDESIVRVGVDLLMSRPFLRYSSFLAPGTILTGATPVYDLVREEIYRRTDDAPLEIPAGAVVVPGARAVTTERGRAWGGTVGGRRNHEPAGLAQIQS